MAVEVEKCCTLLKSGRTEAMRYAIYTGHYECFKHGHINGLDMPFFSYNLAAAYGRMDIMKYSHIAGCQLDQVSACEHSVRGKNYDCLVYSHLNGGQLTPNLVPQIVRLGCFKSMSYALENGLNWTDDSCAQTAYSGNLDFVKFCQAKSCPWTVKNSWDWFHVGSRLTILHLKGRKASVEKEIQKIAECVNYIMLTAEIHNNCAFRDNLSVKMISKLNYKLFFWLLLALSDERHYFNYHEEKKTT